MWQGVSWGCTFFFFFLSGSCARQQKGRHEYKHACHQTPLRLNPSKQNRQNDVRRETENVKWQKMKETHAGSQPCVQPYPTLKVFPLKYEELYHGSLCFYPCEENEFSQCDCVNNLSPHNMSSPGPKTNLKRHKASCVYPSETGPRWNRAMLAHCSPQWPR